MPARYRVLFHTGAEAEAVEAMQYLSDHASPRAARAWYDGLARAIKDLEVFPARFPLAREHGILSGVELRQAVFKSHRLIFVVRGRTVHVLHVRHVARDRLDNL